jgi:hypothetical protein
LLLTLYTIGTYMDREGCAHPGQQLIARGIRASVKTVQRHITQAERMGWLAIEYAGRGGKGWRHYRYRAFVPDAVPLDCVDEAVSDAATSALEDTWRPDDDRSELEGGDTIVSSPTDEAGDMVVSPPLQEGGDSIVSPRGTPDGEGGDTGVPNVATFEREGGDTGGLNVATQLCRTNSRSETPAYRTPKRSSEAHGELTAEEFERRRCEQLARIKEVLQRREAAEGAI